jgi:hypothetical protein
MINALRPRAFGRCGCVSRRRFLADAGMGFTGLVLGAMLFENGAPQPHSRARNVIWLFMMGGTSHLESFDPKPALNQYAGKTFSATPYRKRVLKSKALFKNFRPFLGEPIHETRILPLQVGFRKRGESGIEVSNWWPHVGSCIDDIAVVRSLWTIDFNHSAQALFNTGRMILDGQEPALGSWVHYGLGSLNHNLPQFMVLGRPPSDFGGGLVSHQASYLGPEHDGVPVDADPDKALPYPPHGPGQYRETQRADFELLGQLNRLAAAQHPRDAALQARIKSYELAFGMQTAFLDIVKLDKESRDTRQLYGLDNPVAAPFGRQCLVARRLVERGVRFVQIYHGGAADDDNGLWDSHNDLRKNHSRLCSEVDQPIAGLLKDLKQRGLLDSTLVVWASEFGRAPNVDLRTSGPSDPKDRNGRDHHIYGFSAWLAGGGIKGGVVHGSTDELGFHAVEDRHYITDIHATVLHQLGLDPRRLEIPGRKRLAIEVGKPIREIIA